VAAKKAKATQYELMVMETGDSNGKTEVLTEVSFDELKTIERIAKVLACEKSGVLLEAVKKNVDFWETLVKLISADKNGPKSEDIGAKPAPGASETHNPRLGWREIALRDAAVALKKIAKHVKKHRAADTEGAVAHPAKRAAARK
jgi:hypothetical protein